MKHYWGRLAEAYRIGFHDGGKEDPFDRYFEGPEDYDSKPNTTSVLPLFPEVLEDDAEEEEVADLDGDQVVLDNYIRQFIENLLYEVGCKLIDEIADQVMVEDEDDENEDASCYELRSKKRGDRNAQKDQVSVLDKETGETNRGSEVMADQGHSALEGGAMVEESGGGSGVTQEKKQVPPANNARLYL